MVGGAPLTAKGFRSPHHEETYNPTIRRRCEPDPGSRMYFSTMRATPPGNPGGSAAAGDQLTPTSILLACPQLAEAWVPDGNCAPNCLRPGLPGRVFGAPVWDPPSRSVGRHGVQRCLLQSTSGAGVGARSPHATTGIARPVIPSAHAAPGPERTKVAARHSP